jgi:hypothetical protein
MGIYIEVWNFTTDDGLLLIPEVIQFALLSWMVRHLLLIVQTEFTVGRGQ